MTDDSEPAYVGATTCELVPDWRDTDPGLLALLRAAYDADPDDAAPLLVLADWLAEHDDPRERWVRAGCALWAACRTVEPAGKPWDYAQAMTSLGLVCETAAGWRLACLWGCLVAWHAPAGDGRGPMGRTWVDERVRAANRLVWWWALGFLSNPDAAWSQADAAGRQAYAAGSQADAAWSQADAAGRQAYAAGSQAYAAGSQAYAAGSQADAAGSQAYAAGSQAYAAWSQACAAGSQAYAAGSQAGAAWSQACAAGSQAYAAGRQAYAAESQADAAGSQAYAAGRQAGAAGGQVWQFARQAWELCARRLPDLEMAD